MLKAVLGCPYSYFFGCRGAKKLGPIRSVLLDKLMPRLEIDINLASPLDLKDLFFDSVKEVWCEIGFGSGDHVIDLLTQRSDIGIVCIEPFISGMGNLVSMIHQRGMCGRVRLYCDNAIKLIKWMPSCSLNRIYLLYPDPWPKRRHWKRRIISQGNLKCMSRVLSVGCELRFVSDCSSYVNWTLAHLLACRDFYWTAQTSSDWEMPWHGWRGTRYETKAIQQGRRPTYIISRKV